jgi:L,D-transpeptidase YcbB
MTRQVFLGRCPASTLSPERGTVRTPRKYWHNAKRLLAGSAITLALAFCSLVPCLERALAVEPGAEPPAGSAANPPDGGSPNVPPFLGNPELKARLDPPGKVMVAGERMHEQLLRRFYTAHGYQTVWGSHPVEASHLWEAVLRASEHGFDPRLFHSVAISERGTALTPVERDLLLSDAFLAYADALSRGAMPIEDRADDEDLTAEPVDIVSLLDATMESPDPAKMFEALAPATPEYAIMRRAYAEYRAAQASDGRRKPERGWAISPAAAERRARQLVINLERLRWLPRHIPSDRLVVNAAIARLQLFRDDRPVFTTRVVVGETDKQTPEFQSTIDDILFNPPWNIPRSIVQKEILPKLAADPDYLSHHHMRWRSGGSIQQEAGPYSALGRLKFEMADRYDVYLHDTPQKSLFFSAARMMSHGCVRVENPRTLAQLLLGQGPEAIDRGIALGYTHRRALPNPLPIFIVYQTAYVESNGSIQFSSDPYERDEEIWQHLTRAQPPPLAQDAAVSQRKG